MKEPIHQIVNRIIEIKLSSAKAPVNIKLNYFV